MVVDGFVGCLGDIELGVFWGIHVCGIVIGGM